MSSDNSDNSSYYTDDEGSTSYDDQFEDEPRLKYQRLGGDIPNILKHEKISCFYLHLN